MLGIYKTTVIKNVTCYMQHVELNCRIFCSSSVGPVRTLGAKQRKRCEPPNGDFSVKTSVMQPKNSFGRAYGLRIFCKPGTSVQFDPTEPFYKKLLRCGLRDHGADSLAAERHHNVRLCEHVVGRVAAVVQRRLRVVIVLGYEHFGNARKAHVQSAAFARETDYIKLRTGRHLATGIMQSVDFGMHHKGVLVRLELMMTQQLSTIGIKQVISEQLLFARVRDRFVIKTCRGTVIAGTNDTAIGTYKYGPHLSILVFRKARLGAHHLSVDFVTKLAARLRIIHA